MVPILWILAVGAWVTVAQRIAVAYRELGRLDAERAPAARAGDPA